MRGIPSIIAMSLLMAPLLVMAQSRKPKSLPIQEDRTRAVAEDELKVQENESQSTPSLKKTSPATIHIPKIKFNRPSSQGSRNWTLGWQTFKLRETAISSSGSDPLNVDAKLNGYTYFAVQQPVWTDRQKVSEVGFMGQLGFAQGKDDVNLISAKLGATVKGYMPKGFSAELGVFNEFQRFYLATKNSTQYATYDDSAPGLYLAVNKSIWRTLEVHVKYEYLLPSKNLSFDSSSGLGFGLRGKF